MLIEAEKGRSTFIIEMQKIDKMVKGEANKKKEIQKWKKKDNIEKLKKNIDKKLKELKHWGFICKHLFKDLKLSTPVTTSDIFN